MAQLTLVLNFLKHDLVIQLGAGISPEDEDETKELVIVESSGDHAVRQVGFTRVEEEEEDGDDKYRVRVGGSSGRPH